MDSGEEGYFKVTHERDWAVEEGCPVRLGNPLNKLEEFLIRLFAFPFHQAEKYRHRDVVCNDGVKDV